MPKALQAKLLRALESGEVRRIGENESRVVDVRFVAATNVDLNRAVDAGEFRTDLFYRLNVHRVHLPPLREREGDVRLLIEHFLARYGRRRRDRLLARRAGTRCSRTTTRATCASSSTSSSAPSRSRRARCSSSATCPKKSSPRARRRRDPKGQRRRRPRARRTRHDRLDARAPPRRDLGRRPRASSEPDHDVAAHEEARDQREDLNSELPTSELPFG